MLPRFIVKARPRFGHGPYDEVTEPAANVSTIRTTKKTTTWPI
jgi:hypothetical protein